MSIIYFTFCMHKAFNIVSDLCNSGNLYVLINLYLLKLMIVVNRTDKSVVNM